MPYVLEFPFLQGHILWDSSKQIPEEAKLFSWKPELWPFFFVLLLPHWILFLPHWILNSIIPWSLQPRLLLPPHPWPFLPCLISSSKALILVATSIPCTRMLLKCTLSCWKIQCSTHPLRGPRPVNMKLLLVVQRRLYLLHLPNQMIPIMRATVWTTYYPLILTYKPSTVCWPDPRQSSLNTHHSLI